MAQAALWVTSDTETRRHGERTGLETPVVHAVNDADWVWGTQVFCAEANALSLPPGKYGRKTKTQRN